MKFFNLNSLSIPFIFLIGQVLSQNDSVSSYKNLETKKYYSATFRMSKINGKEVYTLNDKLVDKETYLKFKDTFENMVNCKPCILQTYDENDILLREGITYTDAQVGYFKEYYSNGQIKLRGFYKENTTGNWDNICSRNLCNIPIGTWTYYDEKGEVLYTEKWENGQFIEQIPEQEKTEIWKTELTLNGEDVSNKILLSNEVNQLVISPKFKNSTRENLNFTLKFEASTVGRKVVHLASNTDDLKTVDIERLLIENGFKSNDQIQFSFNINNNTDYSAYYLLQIKVNLPEPNAKDSLIQKDYTVKSINEQHELVYKKQFKTYIVNSLDTTKRIQLKNYIAINYSEKSINDSNSTISTYLRGTIFEKISEDESKIRIDYYFEEIEIENEDGSKSYKETNFSGDEWSSNICEVNTNTINFINYIDKKRNVSNSVGGIITFASALSALIIAPLISSNFKNGSFDKDKYYKIVEYSLAGLTVGIPLIIIGQEKKYFITTKEGKAGADLWYLEISQ